MGGVSNELAGLCAFLGGSQPHQVTLNAMQGLHVQQAMAPAAQAAMPQKEARRRWKPCSRLDYRRGGN